MAPANPEIARRILTAMNEAAGSAVPPITDGEALGLAGLNPQQPYLDWAASSRLPTGSGPGDDPDADGLPNLAEFVFDLDPLTCNPSPVTFAPGPEGIETTYRPLPDIV